MDVSTEGLTWDGAAIDAATWMIRVIKVQAALDIYFNSALQGPPSSYQTLRIDRQPCSDPSLPSQLHIKHAELHGDVNDRIDRFFDHPWQLAREGIDPFAAEEEDEDADAKARHKLGRLVVHHLYNDSDLSAPQLHQGRQSRSA